MVGPSGFVVAIEPSPIVEFLLKNVKINGLRNVMVVKKAVASSKGYLYLKYSRLDPLISKLTIEKNTIRVECEPLDDIVRDVAPNGTVRLLKVDVEGAEVEVLESGVETLKRTDYILVEVEKRNRSQVEQLLSKFKFRIFETPDRWNKSVNLIAKREVS
jgi:FkbM family methyltransferase